MIAVIVATLAADSALMASLPGGVHNAALVGVISRQTTPTAFDANGELRPCALVQGRTTSPAGGRIDAEITTVAIYLYQRSITTAIDAARVRIKTLLHRVRLAPPVGVGAWELSYADDALNRYDPALRAQLHVTTYRLPTRS